MNSVFATIYGNTLLRPIRIAVSNLVEPITARFTPTFMEFATKIDEDVQLKVYQRMRSIAPHENKHDLKRGFGHVLTTKW